MKGLGIFGIVLGVLLCVGFLFFVAQCKIVGAGERGVVTTWGKVEPSIWNEGIHFKRPFSQRVTKFDVRIQKAQEIVGAASKDLQEIKAEVALNYHYQPDKVNDMYQKIGKDIRGVIIVPAINELVKATTARYTAEELITKRESAKIEMRNALTERLRSSFIIVDELSITNFDFSDQFNKAIEEKQTAAQNAIKAERDLERIKIEAAQTIASAEAEAKSTVLNAKAEAESLSLQRAILTPDLIRLRAIEKWDGKLPYYNGSGAVPFIDLK